MFADVEDGIEARRVLSRDVGNFLLLGSKVGKRSLAVPRGPCGRCGAQDTRARGIR